MHCRQTTTAILGCVTGICVAALAAAFADPAHGAAVQITSVPPAEYRGQPAQKKVAPSLLTSADAPVRRVDLGIPAVRDAAPMTTRNAGTAARAHDKGAPLAIGYGRDLSAVARKVRLADLTWLPVGDARATRIEIASPGAAALRVALRLTAAHPDLAVRFAGSAPGATAFGAYPSSTIAQRSATGLYWSPVLEGDTAIVELHAGPEVPLDDLVLEIPRVSHQLVTGAGLRTLSAMDRKAIGSAAACNIDIACVVPVSQAILDTARSVARLSFVADDGLAYLCTGTLINDSLRSFTPYLITANHCIDSAAAASTLNTYWFYDAVACNSTATPPFVQLSGGAALLGRSPDHDWSLLRMFEPPPAGTYFSAWRAEPVPQGAVVSSIHHPKGDLKKWSQGNFTGDVFLGDQGVYGVFDQVIWSAGTTEGGSSGAPLLTFLAAGSYYELRGGLFGGGASCSSPNAPDYYSQLQTALPLLRQYLTPDVLNPTGLTVAVEFYHRALNHYFLSTNPVEINNLDTGATVGWVRTGLRFLVYSVPAAGTSPVCRFYRAPAFGDSHFYSASPAECAQTAAAHPVDWVYESPNVFYVQLPNVTTGACGAGTKPVYRFFNTGFTNHRYTSEVTVRDELAASPGWIPEGYGPGPFYPIMCAVAQ